MCGVSSVPMHGLRPSCSAPNSSSLGQLVGGRRTVRCMRDVVDVVAFGVGWVLLMLFIVGVLPADPLLVLVSLGFFAVPASTYLNSRPQ